MPVVVGFGAVAGGDGDVTPAYPGGVAAGDVAILFVEANGNEVVPAVADYPDEVPGSPLAVGTATRLTCRYRVLMGAESDPLVPDPGNHVAAVLGVFRDVDPDDPFHAIATDAKQGTGTAHLIAGLVTSMPDCLLVLAAALPTDSAGPFSSGEVNASLTDLTERVDAGTDAGGGGGLLVFTGGKAIAGVVDGTQYTLGTAAQATPSIAIALKPKRKVAITGTVTIDGDPAPNAVGVVRIFDLTVGDTEVVADVAGGAGAWSALVRYADHDYVAVYDDGTRRGASVADVAATAHDVVIITEAGDGGPEPDPDPILGTVELVEVPRIDHVARALERLPHSLARLP